MNIQKAIEYSPKPALYEKGTAFMWSDPYISKQTLKIHLDPDLDLGSRKKSTIHKTVEWILNQVEGESLDILDLGCGPGLYTEIYARKGHNVTGMDISPASIEYAREESARKGLKINYIEGSYLETRLPQEAYDLITMIYTDMGVLLPDDREKLLRNITGSLKKGGVLIFDVLNDKDLDKKTSPKNWEVSGAGFWREEPHLVLSESFLYEEKKVILYQHLVIDDKRTDVYRFWTHFFSDSVLDRVLEKHSFVEKSYHKDVLPPGDLFNGDNVTFCKAKKNK
jgi:SAM-dependent methyltransferase